MNMTDKFPHPYLETHGKAFIEFANRDHPVHIFAIECEGHAVGGIGIHPMDDIHKRNAELGYWLAEPYWGQGIISQAIPMALDFAFSHFDIDRVFARPFGTNIASQRVLEKNGFVLEGKFDQVLIKEGQKIDELIYAMRKAHWKK